MVNTVRFKSTLFNASTPPRDYFINPCCYGDDVAQWLAAALRSRGYVVDGPDQEDWGWYVEVLGDVQRYVNVALIEEDATWQIMIELRFSLKRVLSRRRTDDLQLRRDIDGIVGSVRENVVQEWLHLDNRGIESERTPFLT